MTILTGRPRFRDAAALHRRLHRHVRHRRAHRDHVRGDPVRPAGDRHVLRRRPLPLHHLRRRPSSRSSAGCTTGSRRSPGSMYYERPGQISFWILFVGTNLLFFPMHIVGLLGMPRRVYTYPDGLGWTAYNLVETIGGFVTLAGILLLLGNLVVSATSAAPAAGPDPVARADARVDDQLAAAGVQLRGHPEGLERRTRTGTPPTASATAAALARRSLVLERRARAARGRRSIDARLRRGRPDAARVAVAARAGARALAASSSMLVIDQYGVAGDHGDLRACWRWSRLALDRSRRSNDGLRRRSPARRRPHASRTGAAGGAWRSWSRPRRRSSAPSSAPTSTCASRHRTGRRTGSRSRRSSCR